MFSLLSILASGWLATRFQRKGLVICGLAVIAAIGTLLMILVPRSNHGVLLFGYYLVSLPV
jgi:MFS family permease